MKKYLIIIAIAIFSLTLVLIILSLVNKTDPVQENVVTNTNTSDTVSTIQTKDQSIDLDINPPTISDDFAVESFPVKLQESSNIFFEIAKNFSNIKNDKLSLVVPTNDTGVEQDLYQYLQKVGTIIPSEMLGASTIKMYIWKGNKDFGPSEALVIKNNNKAQVNADLVKQFEGNLAEYLKGFVLIGEKYDLVQSSGRQDRQFSDSGFYRYGRFVNYTSDRNISLNYVVADNYIIFANSLSILHNLTYKAFVLGL